MVLRESAGGIQSRLRIWDYYFLPEKALPLRIPPLEEFQPGDALEITIEGKQCGVLP